MVAPLTPDPPLSFTFTDDLRPGFFADVWQRFFVQLKRFLGVIPASNLAWDVQAKTHADTGYIAAQGELVAVDATAGATTIKLPTVASVVGGTLTGASVIVKKVDASGHAVTVDGNGTTIDGATTKALAAQWNAAAVTYNGAAWLVTGTV